MPPVDSIVDMAYIGRVLTLGMHDSMKTAMASVHINMYIGSAMC